MSDLKTIRLYGKLGARFGRVHRLAVSTPAEAVRALCSQYPGFQEYMTQAKDNGFGFAVFTGKKNLKTEDLKNPVGAEDIRIAPVTFGAKKNGVFSIILGIILVVVGVIMNIYAPGSGVFLIKMGVMLIVGGVVQMLTPVPKAPKEREAAADNPSYVFNGPVNTQAQGNPVPVVYGRLIVGSAVISAGILANQNIAGRPPRPVWDRDGDFSDTIEYLQRGRAWDQEYPDGY